MKFTLIAPRSLRSTVLLPMLAVGLCAAFATIVGAGLLVYASMHDSLQQRAELIAHTANYVAESVSRTGEIQRVISAMGAEQDVRLISVIGGVPPQIQASTRQAWAGRRLADIPDLQQREDIALALSTRVVQSHELPDSSALSVTVPSLLSNSDHSNVALRNGVVAVHLDTRSTYRAAWIAVLISTIGFVLLFSLVGALGYVLFRRQILTPLSVIGRHLSDRSTGAVFPASILARTDEISVVARALDQALTSSEVALNNLEHQQHALDAHAIVSVADLAGDITYVNERFCSISGYSREELLGANHRIVNSGHHPPEFFRELWATIAAGKVWHGQFCNRSKDGSIYWVESTLFPLLDLSGKPHHYIGIRTDITEGKEASEEILRLNASLEERVQQRTEELEEKVEQLDITSKYKSEFLSNMSHELRTPLNSLLILSQLLAQNAERNLSEQQIKYAKTINGAGKDLLELINEILDLSKIESGTVTLELQDVSLANVREQVERSFRHVAQSRSLGFGVELAPGLPPSLYTDSQRLQQVMKNLLSNAFKFTQKGQVSVRIEPVESGWSVDHAGLKHAQTVLGFFVADSGIGLAADKQKIIFEAFQQADTGTARKYGGTGLGLSISREIARLLGGELRLAMSEPGKGSTFVLYLPLRAPEPGQGRTSFTPFTPDATQRAPAAQEGAADANPQPPAALDDRAAIKPGERRQTGERRQVLEKLDPSAASLAGKKVLVVDDDVRNIFALTAVLERHKMAALYAENGRAALEELGRNPDVDIVLMDIMMPVMDGFETMRQIRQMKQFESLPIIALTAKAMKGDREKCIEAGASDYVSKPTDTEQLLSLLRVWLCR